MINYPCRVFITRIGKFINKRLHRVVIYTYFNGIVFVDNCNKFKKTTVKKTFMIK